MKFRKEDVDEISFQKIFDANVSTLTEYSHLYEGKTSQSFYIDILLAYMTADLNGLEKLFNKFKTLESMDYQNEILEITELRILARRGVLSKKKCEDFHKKIKTFDDLWKGEAYFMLALAYAKLKLYIKAKDYFQLSFIELRKAGCKRKVLLAFQNFLAGVSNSEPGIVLVNEFLFLIKEAHRMQVYDIEALTLLNLSREFQEKNATLLALKFCEQAEELGEENLGSLQYWLILAHKADLFIELKRIHEATLVFEELQGADSLEIKQAIEVLKAKLANIDDEIIDKTHASPTWENRLTEKYNRPPEQVGELEQELVSFILEQDRTKKEILNHLYGDNLDRHILDNRFKKIMAKVRKKLPGIIFFDEGVYTSGISRFINLYEDAK